MGGGAGSGLNAACCLVGRDTAADGIRGGIGKGDVSRLFHRQLIGQHLQLLQHGDRLRFRGSQILQLAGQTAQGVGVVAFILLHLVDHALDIAQQAAALEIIHEKTDLRFS